MSEKYVNRNDADFQEEFSMPETVIKCLSGILNITNGEIYDPCCGSGNLLCKIAKETEYNKNLSFYGQTFLNTEQSSAQIREQLKNEIGNIYIEDGNTLADDRLAYKKFDIILANPPFNFSDEQINCWNYSDPRWVFGYPQRSNANFAWIQHIIYHLNKTGRAGIIMPTGSLFTNDTYQKQIRRNIIESGILEAIITFPRYLFYSTNIPFCIWLINNGVRKNKNILFVEASRIEPLIQKELLPEHIDMLVSLVTSHREGKLSGNNKCYSVSTVNEVAQNDYSLSPNLYLESNYTVNNENSLSQLKEICSEIYKLGFSEKFTEILKSLDKCMSSNWTKKFLLDLYDSKVGISKRKTTSKAGCPIIDVNTVINNRFLPNRIVKRADISKAESEKYDIKIGDILINRTSEAPKSLGCGCAVVSDCNAVFDIFTKRLRPRTDEVDPMYVSGFISSDIYRKQIIDFTPTYTIKSCLNGDTLQKVSIYFPDINVQKNIGKILYAIFNEMQLCEDDYRLGILKELEMLFIHNYITFPILNNFE